MIPNSLPQGIVQLIAQWRAEVKERAGVGCGCYGISNTLRRCADQLASLCPVSLCEQKPDLTRGDGERRAAGTAGSTAIPLNQTAAGDSQERPWRECGQCAAKHPIETKTPCWCGGALV